MQAMFPFKKVTGRNININQAKNMSWKFICSLLQTQKQPEKNWAEGKYGSYFRTNNLHEVLQVISELQMEILITVNHIFLSDFSAANWLLDEDKRAGMGYRNT